MIILCVVSTSRKECTSEEQTGFWHKCIYMDQIFTHQLLNLLHMYPRLPVLAFLNIHRAFDCIDRNRSFDCSANLKFLRNSLPLQQHRTQELPVKWRRMKSFLYRSHIHQVYVKDVWLRHTYLTRSAPVFCLNSDQLEVVDSFVYVGSILQDTGSI